MNNDWRQFKSIYIYIYIFFIYHVFFSIFITFLYTECLIYHEFLNIFVIFVFRKLYQDKIVWFGMTNIIICNFYDCFFPWLSKLFFCRLMYVFFIMQDFVLEFYLILKWLQISLYSLKLKFFLILYSISMYFIFLLTWNHILYLYFCRFHRSLFCVTIIQILFKLFKYFSNLSYLSVHYYNSNVDVPETMKINFVT